MNPANDHCQRWTHGQQSWRHRSDGGFDSSRYDVEPILADTPAKDYVLAHHYSGTWPSALLRYGLYDDGELVGVAVLSAPTNNKVLTNVFPGLVALSESMELGRFHLADSVASNGETYFLRRVFELARRQGVRGIVSFSDPEPRIIDGRVLFPGHIGHIYQAKGAVYCGRGTRRTKWVFPDGSVLSAKTMQKIRDQDKGHAGGERKLVSFGARPRRAFENPAAWLNEVKAEVCTPLRHPGDHRYVFPIGVRPRHIAMAPQPYPTRERTAA